MTDDPAQSGPDNAAAPELEERYRQLAEQSPDSIAIHHGGHMVYLNPAGAHFLGAENPDLVLSKSVLDFVRPDMLPIARAEFLSVATDELRTPVTSLRAEAQYLNREFERVPDRVPGTRASI